MSTVHGVSVVVPVLNEIGNISPLLDRLYPALDACKLPYEIVFVDDGSTDGSIQLMEQSANLSPNVKLFHKNGRRGKAYSIIEGVGHARYDTVCMIDADLQYAPENIPGMLDLMLKGQYDVVITNRQVNETSFLRQTMSRAFHFIFTKTLFGIDYDSQSGLKLFKRSILSSIRITPSPWSSDLEFIVKSLIKGYRIASFDITFEPRHSGDVKISVIKSSLELATESLKLRRRISLKDLRRNYKANQTRSAVLMDLS